MTTPSDASTNGSATVSNGSSKGSPDRLATVVEAAEILGITPDAVRSRLRRGTLKRSPERGEEGEVLVILPAPSRTGADQVGDPSQTVADPSTDSSGGQSATFRDASPTVALVEAMQERIEHLSKIIDTRDEEIRRRDTIIMTLSQRIPELEAPAEGLRPEATPEPRDGPEMASPRSDKDTTTPEGSQEPSQRRSWLYRFFFGP